MSKEERLRLLLIEQEGYEENHRTGISHGAAAVFAKWPSYIASAIWCTVFIVSLVTLVMLITFISLIKQGKIVEGLHDHPSMKGYKQIQSEFCHQMTDKDHEKRQSIPEKDLEIFDSGQNIFYLDVKPLEQYSACGVESVLRICRDRNVFLMLLNSGASSYENSLRAAYKNFNILSIDGEAITRGSPFEGKWKADNRSLFEVALLTVWQFGGTVIPEQLLMLNSRLYEREGENCQTSEELIYCPNQCSSYVYELIGETLKGDTNQSVGMLIDNSITRFCGSEHFIHTGCTGVSRIDKMDICQTLDSRCMFVRTKDWLANDHDAARTKMFEYCPVTYKTISSEARRTSSYTNNKQKKRTKLLTDPNHIVLI